jgi:hypothetical protein
MLSLCSTHNTSSPPVPKASSPNLSARDPNDRLPLECLPLLALRTRSWFPLLFSFLLSSGGIPSQPRVR